MRKSARKSKLAKENPTNGKNAKPLRIAIVGVGRLGTTLGRALQSAGHQIKLVVAGHPANARRSARLFGRGTAALSAGDVARPTEAMGNILRECDLILIATPDDAVATVTAQLSRVLKEKPIKVPLKSRKIALHTSGALSSEKLKPLRAAGFSLGSLHPLISVADANSSPKIFKDAFFCIEGDRPAVSVARLIVRNLKARSFTIDAASKPLYHAAAVMSSGHITALFSLAVAMLEGCGLSPQRAQQVLLPLVESNTANLLKKSPARALTGPFARGDLATIEAHLKALKSGDMAAARAAYVVLGQRALEMDGATLSSEHSDKIARVMSQFRHVKG